MFDSITALDNIYWTTDIEGKFCRLTDACALHYSHRIITRPKAFILNGAGKNEGMALEINDYGRIVALLRKCDR